MVYGGIAAPRQTGGVGRMLGQDSEVEKEFDDPGHFLASERVQVKLLTE